MFQKKKVKEKRDLKDKGKKQLKEEKSTKKDTKKELKKRNSIQNAIYYDLMYKSGICALSNLDTYSAMIRFSDINYQIINEDEQRDILEKYMQLLNSMGNEDNVQLLVINKPIDGEAFEKSVLLDSGNDGLDYLRKEYNQMLMDKISKGNNSIVTEKYLVFNAVDEDEENAKRNLQQMIYEYERKFKDLGCKVEVMNGEQRLEVFNTIMHPGQKMYFSYDNLKGYDTTKDCIAPDELTFSTEDFKLDGRYCQIYYLRDYSTELGDDLINKLTKIQSNITISFNMRVIPRGEDIALLKNKISFMEAEKSTAQQQAIARGFDPDISISLELRSSLEEAHEELKNVEKRNQRMFECQFLVMVNEESEEKREEVAKSISVIAKEKMCQLEILRMQQEEGFNACLPIGYRVPHRSRTLETPQCGILIPFTSQELMDKENAIYYGVNSITKNLIMCNRTRLKNSNGWIFGVSGSGKSMSAKREILSVILASPKDDIVVIDPENEYQYLANLLGGSVLNINNISKIHINAMDGDVSEEDYLVSKADFVQSFLCQIFNRDLEPDEKSLVDIATRQVLLEYMTRKKIQEQTSEFNGVDVMPPTLLDVYKVLENREEAKAKSLALAMQMYVNGTYDLFSGQTNIDLSKQMTVYNIRETESTIKPVAMLVILESLWSKIIRNQRMGKRTWIWIDEIYLLFKDEYSARFLEKLFKRARKYGAVLTGITQNVGDLIISTTGQNMLANSEFIYMLSQYKEDMDALSELLNIGDEQMSYLQNAQTGSGLLYNGNGIVIPFEDRFPKNTKMYEAMTSDFTERQSLQGKI